MNKLSFILISLALCTLAQDSGFGVDISIDHKDIASTASNVLGIRSMEMDMGDLEPASAALQQNDTSLRYYREVDIDSFRVILNEKLSSFYLEAINLGSGEQYGPEPVFQDLNREVIIESFSGELVVSKVSDSAIFITLPIYTDQIELDLVTATDSERKIAKLEIQVQDLRNEVSGWRNEIENLKKQK